MRKLLPFVVFLILAAIGGGVWYLLERQELGGAAVVIEPFLPEVVGGIFVLLALVVTAFFHRSMSAHQYLAESEQSARKQLRRHELIIEGLQDGVWDWNFHTGRVAFSSRWKKMLGFSAGGDPAGTSENARHTATVGNTADWWAGRVHPDDLPTLNQRLEAYFSGNRPYYEVQYRIMNGHGDYVWVLDRGKAEKGESGKFSRMAGMTTDIQDQKNVEKVLKQRTDELEEAKEHIEASRSRTEAVLSSIGEGVIAVDETGSITVANAAAARMLGFSREGMIGMNYMEAVPQEENRGQEPVEKENRAVYKTLATKKIQSGVFHYYRHDTEKLPVSVTASPIMQGGKPSGGAIVVFRDITREMEIDQQKTEFVSLASHQLRTPLSAIRWYSEMVLSEKLGELSDKQKTYIEEVYTSNLRMIELVNSLLNVSRIEMGTFAVEPSEVDIHELIRGVVTELEPSINDKDQELIQNYESAPQMLHIDKDLMRIVFQNLLSNAVKYTPEGGRIALAVYPKGNYLRIEVADNGYGIPEKQQPKMFGKLFRADNVKAKDTEGTGLGLYVIKSVVEKTGGQIWFDSTEDQGTTFYVELPITGMPTIKGSKGLEGQSRL